MSDLLATAAAWLSDVLAEHVSQSVVYWRGATAISLSATVGRTEHQVANERSFIETEIFTDFLVAVAELMVDDVPITPARGDKIEWDRGAQVDTYLVLPLSDGRVFEVDAARSRYRIHTKLELAR